MANSQECTHIYLSLVLHIFLLLSPICKVLNSLLVWSLPRSGASVMIDIVNTISSVHSSFPAKIKIVMISTSQRYRLEEIMGKTGSIYGQGSWQLAQTSGDRHLEEHAVTSQPFPNCPAQF